MAEKRNPGALVDATGAGLLCHATAAGTRNIATGAVSDNALAHHLAFLAASLDPATLATLGLTGARIAGMLTWGEEWLTSAPTLANDLHVMQGGGND